MKPRVKKAIRFTIRWGIAVVGIFWILSNISMDDRVLVQGADGWPVSMRLAKEAREDDSTFVVKEGSGERTVGRGELIAKSERDKVVLASGETVAVLGQKVIPNTTDRSTWPVVVARPRNLWQRYWDVHSEVPARTIAPSEIAGGYRVVVPYPLIDIGVRHMVREADPWLLLGSILVFPIAFMITSIRWHRLMRALGINVGLFRAFTLNVVGNFYNTFLPGSTGGDVLKAYYAAKHTDHKTRAVMSVIIDRIIGLLALVILGGSMAAYQYAMTAHQADAATRKCAQVALASAAILAMVGIGLSLFFHPMLRRAVGMDWLLTKLPMQGQVRKAMEVMEIYRTRATLIFWAILVTLPVHIAVVVSAMLAGKAFGLPISTGYYFVAVPVIVLVGAIPVSPQGAGVMEFFAIILTKSQGATVSQAFALTMSIRMVQILWNLLGGIFVLRGGYHAPTVEEQHELEEEPGGGVQPPMAGA